MDREHAVSENRRPGTLTALIVIVGLEAIALIVATAWLAFEIAVATPESMATAVALATDVCFRELGLHRMEICIRPENSASLRVVQKLGFRYEGLRRRYIHIDGDWRDHYSFALVRDEVPEGVLERWVSGHAPRDAADIPPQDRLPSGPE